MLQRIAKTLRLSTLGLAGPILLLHAQPAGAQQAPPPLAPARFDPADVYFQGFLATRAAEQLEETGDFAAAAAKLVDARKMFNAIHKYYPDWNVEMLSDRMQKNTESEQRIYPKAEEQRKKNRAAVAELEGGVRQGGEIVDPAEDVEALTPPGILQVDPLASRRLSDAEAEVARLKGILSTKPDLAEASRNESRVRDIARQRDTMRAQLDAAEKNLDRLRGKLASKPVENEIKSLQDRIASIQQEHRAMGMALDKSRAAHTEAMAQIDILQADLRNVQKKRADLDRDLKTERDVANKVIAGQRTQLEALQKELDSKSEELGQANERIAGLVRQLDESRDSFDQLRTERDALVQERDQMSALLKLNEDGRIEDLIQQNMGLSKDLREANERVEQLGRDDNTTKDQLTVAKNDLVVAKARINRLIAERRRQDENLADLKKRLKGEETALANGDASSNPQEVEMLRDIIRRQLRVQERRSQARDLLVEAAKDMGAKDEKLAQAVKLFDAQEIRLTPDEEKLLAEKNVDFELVSPIARDSASVGRATAELKRDISVFERTAEKSFAAGRYLSTRELFEMIVEQHPGYVPALCRLGVVNLKLNDPPAAVDTFRRAAELDPENPYAHRMLGYSHLLQGDLSAAEQSASQAVKLAPDDALSQILLGQIYGLLNRLDDAETHFKAAISADPLISDSYYNLALICLRTKRLQEASDYYNLALDRGALPDPALEQRLSKQ